VQSDRLCSARDGSSCARIEMGIVGLVMLGSGWVLSSFLMFGLRWTQSNRKELGRVDLFCSRDESGSIQLFSDH
jgi:hypothetical protein